MSAIPPIRPSKSPEETAALIASIEPWIAWRANVYAKLFNRPHLAEDLAQIARLQAFQCAKTHDLAKGANFLTYTRQIIDARLYKAARKLSRQVSNGRGDVFEISLETPICEHEGDALYLSDILPDPHDQEEHLEDSDWHTVTLQHLDAALLTLPPRDRDIIASYFYREENVRYTAKRLSVTHQAVYKRLPKLLSTLRKRIESAQSIASMQSIQSITAPQTAKATKVAVAEKGHEVS
jgi:RNA polymerase sigma factor (sigma-70 family)